MRVYRKMLIGIRIIAKSGFFFSFKQVATRNADVNPTRRKCILRRYRSFLFLLLQHSDIMTSSPSVFMRDSSCWLLLLQSSLREQIIPLPLPKSTPDSYRRAATQSHDGEHPFTFHETCNSKFLFR